VKPLHFVFTCIVFAAGLALAQNPVPLINQSLIPASAAPGGSGFTLTVNGTGFVSGATVNWNGSALATIFISSSQLTATVPASNIAKAGTAAITVNPPPPGGSASNVVFFPIAIPELDMYPVSHSVSDGQFGVSSGGNSGFQWRQQT
jgi:hypothetical protein